MCALTIVSVPVSALTAVIAAPVIVDTSLTPVSTFSVNITVTNVEKMWGYQFRLYYNTTILTATDYGSYSPFTVEKPSGINDTAGLAGVSYSMQMGEKVGFSTVDPAPMAWIGFTVDAYGISSLDLRKSQLVTVDAEVIPHDVSDGYFGNDGLLSKYNDLLADYVTLNTTYHLLLTEYNDLLTRYDQLNSTYSSLLANLTQLQTNYDSLQSGYDSLSADFSNLETDYNTLQANYNSLETAYDSLNSIYNSPELRSQFFKKWLEKLQKRE